MNNVNSEKFGIFAGVNASIKTITIKFIPIMATIHNL